MSINKVVRSSWEVFYIFNRLKALLQCSRSATSGHKMWKWTRLRIFVIAVCIVSSTTALASDRGNSSPSSWCSLFLSSWKTPFAALIVEARKPFFPLPPGTERYSIQLDHTGVKLVDLTRQYGGEIGVIEALDSQGRVLDISQPLFGEASSVSGMQFRNALNQMVLQSLFPVGLLPSLRFFRIRHSHLKTDRFSRDDFLASLEIKAAIEEMDLRGIGLISEIVCPGMFQGSLQYYRRGFQIPGQLRWDKFEYPLSWSQRSRLLKWKSGVRLEGGRP